MTLLFQFVILGAFLPLCTSLLCLHCDNVYRTSDCQKVSKCQTGEACFVEQDANGHGYNLGCRAEQTCSNTTSPVCTQCCKTDTCNSGNMCGISGLSKTGGPLCYSCTSLLDFEDCTKVTQCQKDELCYTEITKNSVLGVDIHSHSCKATQDCPGTGVFSSTGCNSCCAGSMCNTNCTHAGTSIHSHTNAYENARLLVSSITFSKCCEAGYKQVSVYMRYIPCTYLGYILYESFDEILKCYTNKKHQDN